MRPTSPEDGLVRDERSSLGATADVAAVINSTNDLIWSVNRDYRLTSANRAFYEHTDRLLGVRLEPGMTPADVLPPDMAACFVGLYERALSGERFQLERVQPDERTLELTFNPIVQDGVTVGVSVFGTDVTEKKAVESAFREAERKYRDILEGAVEGMFQTTPGGRILMANPALARMLGYDSVQELLALTDAATELWMDPNERRQVALTAEVKGFEPGYECQLKRKDGTPIWVSISGRRVTGPDGRTLHYEGFIEDIAGRKQMADALRKSEEKFAKAFQFSPTVITLANVDDGDRLIDVNQAFEDFLGYRREEVIGRTTSELRLWANEEEYAELLEHVRVDKRLSSFEAHFRRKDGTIVIGLISAEAIELAGEICVLAATVDITERKRADAEKSKLEDQLRHAQKMESIGRLAGGVAHDFNNLLTVINGYSALLLKTLSADEIQGFWAAEINRAGELAASLTKQLLALSRKQVIDPKPLDLNAVVRDAERMLEPLLGADIRLVTTLDPNLGQVMADSDQLHQVLINLVVNARDAMPDGGTLRIETRNMKVAATATPDAVPGDCVVMTVIDSGIGMDRDTLQHAFEPFFTTKEAGKGTGLGLSMVHGIIRQSGGWIDVASERGAGTTFSVYLPRRDSRNSQEHHVAEAADTDTCETILLVEDQAAVRKFTTTVLESYGYKVLGAADAGEAFALVKSYASEIRLLLTDVVLPGMNGKDLSQQIKSRCPDVKVIFMSGYPSEVIAYRGVLDDNVAYIPKPFSPQTLAAKIREVLANGPKP